MTQEKYAFKGEAMDWERMLGPLAKEDMALLSMRYGLRGEARKNAKEAAKILEVAEEEVSRRERNLFKNFHWERKEENSGAPIEVRENALREIIEELPDRQAQVVRLYYYNEMTLREIGQEISMSEPRVAQIHQMAMMQIKKKLEEKFITEEEFEAIVAETGWPANPHPKRKIRA